MNEKLESNLVGVAGEYLVAGELSRRGFIASITLRNSRGIDIIASNSDGSKSVSIQVKTNSDGGSSWILNKKSEEYFSDNHFYVFVALGPINERPKFHIVPSEIVSKTIYKEHREWLSMPKRNGEKRKDTNMRKFSDSKDQYLDKWSVIKL